MAKTAMTGPPLPLSGAQVAGVAWESDTPMGGANVLADGRDPVPGATDFTPATPTSRRALRSWSSAAERVTQTDRLRG